jgi:hypothetical protein
MDLKLESREGFLLATATGQVSLDAVLELHRKICDAATERGFNKILYDCSAITGELSVLEEYQIAKTVAAYCVSKSVNPKVALIGKPPAVTGFAAEVASNRGLLVVTFSERQAGLDWLKGFGSKATAT